MNRAEFFSRLNAAMSGFPVTEINRVNEHYNEYWDDAAEAGKSEEETASGLDSPEEIAGRVRAEFAFGRAQSSPGPKSMGQIVLIVVIAVFAAPIALPVALGFAGALFGIVAAIFAVALALACVVLAMLVTGVALVISGVPTVVSVPVVGLWMLGGGLLLTGLGLLMGIGCAAIIRLMFRLCARAFRGVHSRVSGKSGKQIAVQGGTQP